ncbi:MAG: acetyltransferase [Alphaproteobacteria bacterium]|nr:acetyltransferase [Alphaproteobacteria bacterium]
MAAAAEDDALAPVTLRPFTPVDWPRLLKWLRDPAVERWWGSPSSSEAGIRLVLETTSALGRMIEVAGRPVGYTHAIDAACWGEQLPDVLPQWTWDVDIFIGEPEFRGRHVGEAALDLLADEVFSTTFAMALSVFVSVRNESAVRAYERAGFKWVTVWEDSVAGPEWLMLRKRPTKNGGPPVGAEPP